MPKVRVFQSNFNSGVLDSAVAARLDIKHYYNGAEELTNVIGIPQGGVDRRGGTDYLGSLPSLGKLVPFSFSTEQTYMLVFTDLRMYVYRNDALVTGINGTANDYLDTPWALADLDELNWTQSADTLILVHPDYEPRSIVRDGQHYNWTINTLTFTNPITFEYGRTHPNVAITPAAVSGAGIALSSDLDWFASGDIGATIVGNGGTATVTTFVDAKNITITTSTPFDDTTEIATGDWSFDMSTASTPSENIMSARRGWPRSTTFHQGRLWFAGFRSRPQTFIGSQTNNFFDFSVSGTPLDDESIDATLDTDQINAIRHIVSGRHLQLFTTGGEFYVPVAPITPANITAYRQTPFGASLIKPTSADGATIYSQKTGKTIREFIFSYTEEAYVSNSLSVLSPSLINSPVSMAARHGSTDSDANYIYVANGDGTVAVMNTLREQEIAAWYGPWNTAASGKFKSVGVIGDDVYFLVERVINAATVYYLEKLNTDRYTDCAIYQTYGVETTVITGLGVLEGETVRVKADGSVMQSQVVTGGQITLERGALAVEVGLGFNPIVTPMPPNAQLEDGYIANKKRRISRVTLNVENSLGLYVNGKQIPDRKFGEAVLDNPPTPFTGQKRIQLLGWSRNPKITITQQDPLPARIRSVEMEVKT